jgi:hypothetical protein
MSKLKAWPDDWITWPKDGGVVVHTNNGSDLPIFKNFKLIEKAEAYVKAAAAEGIVAFIHTRKGNRGIPSE